MTGPQFTHRLHRQDHEITIALSGPFDLAALDRFHATAAGVLADPRIRSVRLDCSGVSFIDCAAIGAIVRLRERAQAADVSVLVEHPSAAMMRVLRLTNAAIPVAAER